MVEGPLWPRAKETHLSRRITTKASRNQFDFSATHMVSALTHT